MRRSFTSGEAEYTRYGYRDLIQQRLVDVVQPELFGVRRNPELKRFALWHRLE